LNEESSDLLCVPLGHFVNPAAIEDAPALLAVMDRYRIGEAPAQEYHAQAFQPLENGSRRLLDMVRGLPMLERINTGWVRTVFSTRCRSGASRWFSG